MKAKPITVAHEFARVAPASWSSLRWLAVKEIPLDNRGYRANRSKKHSKRYILFGEKTLPL